MKTRLTGYVRSAPARPITEQLVIGIVAGLLALAIRLALPLGPQQLPTFTVIIALAIVTTFVGTVAGVATAVVGGVASWYLLFDPWTFRFEQSAWLPLLAFTVMAITIVVTASLYRQAMRELYEREVELERSRAEDAVVLAREMGHRLKNNLAIVQSIAFQTMGQTEPKSQVFASRLRTLASANELLTDHVTTPVPACSDVFETALAPFREGRRIRSKIEESYLPDSQVISLALALHELATNSIKYGAWSTEEGEVEIVVESSKDRLRFSWQEHGGPPVEDPQRKGFGTRLLHRCGAEAELDFAKNGVRFSTLLRSAGPQ